ncbi:PREDICTED: cilia- and flagella-associated protein 61-like [Papilio polytes]|uniref:cilia- and flagella-associated protein 61-like n=1 Tax=Papilio polytes TaxID=76194 RepID=UPI00067685E8|nr:PREDICTED: cilia- and flagella-associated protein 61-like [Papilio polytes]
MSIYFNFDVGPKGRRFRRAIDGDKADIEYIIKKTYGEVYGGADIGSLIELSTLSICMIDVNKDVIGFMALSDHPNVPGVSQVDWEIWMRNLFQKYFLSRNTLFIHYICCLDDVADFFLEEALTSVFTQDVYLNNIVVMIPHGCPEDHITRYLASKKRNFYKYLPSKMGSGFREGNCSYFYAAMRQDFCPKLKIRGAVEEDNDDIVEILDKKCPQLKELYGEYYISEIISRHPTMKRKVIVAAYQDHVIGVMCLNAEVNYENLQNTYELHPYYGLRKATPLEKELKKRNNILLKTFGEPILYGRWGPFDRTSKAKQKVDEDIPPGETAVEPRIKTSSKVIFRHISLTEDRYDRVYMKKDVSDDYSVKLGGTSPTVSLLSNASVAELLDEDPFDYEIVNIDTKLLKVPRVISRDYEPKSQSDRQSTLTEFETKLKRRTSVMAKKQEETSKYNYSGEPNAFIIELFGCREDVDYKQSFDFLEAAFEAMKDYDYCILRMPCTEKSYPLLQHFCVS